MNTLVAVLVILISFYIMAKVVDDQFIKSLDIISKRLKLKPSVAGATLMAIGTSAPELSTSLYALFLPNANPGLGVGTVIGSAIFQILVVIGFAALVRTAYLNWRPVLRDGAFYAFSIFLLIAFVQDGVFTVIEATILLLTYILYLFIIYLWSLSSDVLDEPNPLSLVDQGMLERKEKKKEKPNGFWEKVQRVGGWITFPLDWLLDLIPDPEKNERWTWHVFFYSLAMIGFLSYWLVLAAEELALGFGVPSTVVALTILAGGSSVPEMISSAIVSKQGRGDMAISNAIGSNVFDILISMGLPIFIYTLVNGSLTDFGGENVTSSIFLLFATLIAVFVLLASQKFKAGRAVGVFLMLAYVAYVFMAYTGLL